MAEKKYEVKQTLIVNHKGKDYSILAGINRDIPEELFQSWFVKAHVKNGNISEMKEGNVAVEEVDPDSIAAERNRIISETEAQAESIISNAREEADKIVAAAKEEAEMLAKAAEENAQNIVAEAEAQTSNKKKK